MFDSHTEATLFMVDPATRDNVFTLIGSKVYSLEVRKIFTMDTQHDFIP